MQPMKNQFDFLDEFGKIDHRFIADAGRPWTKKRISFLQVYGRRAACILLIIIIGAAAAASPEIQAAIGEFTTKIGQIFGIKDDLTPYARILNTAQTKDGIRVTLKEIILDENKLFVLISAEDTAEHGEMFVGTGDFVKVNGQEVCCNGSGISSGSSLERQSSDYVLEFSFDNKTEIPKENAAIELEMRITRDSADIAEATPFVLKFTATRGELEKSTRRKSLDLTVDGGEGTVFQFTEVSINSVSSRITAKCEAFPEEIREFYLKGMDSKGNPVCYRAGEWNADTEEITFESCSETGSGDTVIEEEDRGVLLPDVDADFVELQLYAVTPDWYKVNPGDSGGVEDGDEEDAYEVVESGYTIDDTTLEAVGEEFVVKLGE